ncbi:GreA/GreB family elongation factor [Actinospongicola halichondriae]|uniref:GreA/GreB family elongation factor n=1 Tax=Actinospongicola halichondriae TaxID=3236844 RepID=UPI003D45D9AC
MAAQKHNPALTDELPDKHVHELTQAAYDRLKAEYDELTTVKKIDIARKIEAARELGDLSENGDYHAAKEEQGKMAGRIGHIFSILENHVIVEAGGSSVVRVGSVVEIRYDGDTDTERYLVGSIEERSDELEVISPGSALGESLMGASIDQTVEYETPTGATLSVTVVGIE